MSRRILIAMLLATLLSGCDLFSPTPTPTPNATAAVRPRSTAAISILSPQSGATITSSSMLVRFDLKGGRIVTQTSTNLTPDEGHIHLSIDGRLISMNYQLQQTVSLQPFTAGPHVLQGEFVAKDHAPFNPRVIVKEIFEYQPSGS